MASGVLMPTLVVLSWLAVTSSATNQNDTLDMLSFSAYPGNRDGTLRSLSSMFADGSMANVSDVVCLQNVLNDTDMANLTGTAAGAGFPHSASFLDTPASPTESACLSTNFLELGTCLSMECSAELGSVTTTMQVTSILSCLLDKCASQATQLTQTCINCITTQGLPGLLKDVTSILPASFGRGTCFSNVTKADSRSSYGLLLLSRFPLSNVARNPLQQGGSFLARGYIRATVNAGGQIGSWAVACTHLYSNRDFIAAAFQAPEADAARLNQAQITTIIRDAEIARSPQAAILGNMNHGWGAYQSTYESVLATGYCSPYATQVNECTVCADNPFNKMNPTTYNSSLIVDHIYVKSPGVTCSNGTLPSGSENRMNASRLFAPVGQAAPLSDHNAVRVIALGSPSSSGSRAALSTLSLVLVCLAAAMRLI